VSSRVREEAVRRAALALSCGRDDQASLRVLEAVWDEAFEEGRLAALDELQDRLCVCMK
jgi:hypothetical protein